jgi:hypothetical protein
MHTDVCVSLVLDFTAQFTDLLAALAAGPAVRVSSKNFKSAAGIVVSHCRAEGSIRAWNCKEISIATSSPGEPVADESWSAWASKADVEKRKTRISDAGKVLNDSILITLYTTL